VQLLQVPLSYTLCTTTADELDYLEYRAKARRGFSNVDAFTYLPTHWDLVIKPHWCKDELVSTFATVKLSKTQ